MDKLTLTQTLNCLCANLRRASRGVTQLYDDALRPTGLRATQFTLLSAVGMHKQIATTELAEALGMDQTTATRAAQVLQKQGLVKSLPGEDRRVRLIALTAQGKTLLAEALPLWESVQGRMVEQLGGDERDALLGLLAKMSTFS